ncbi:MAG: HDOD domain-containing protein [Myxococcales bacterium]|nr:HDOD domain-containing protein [Myxococcales bacterium]MCB9536459.1 HDOD domain-containing protein [Myxococcales bacterium]
MSRYVDIADPPPTETPESQQLLDAIGRRMLRRRVDALKSLPTFPESVIRINQILAAEDTDESFERIAAVIEIDPVLTARVLRLVNSAFYGVSGAVATVYDALVMLGLDVVKGIILSTNAMDLLSSGLGGLRGLWEHCFGAAVAAGALARVLGLSGAAELSAAALMHDIGKVVLATQLPGDYAEVVEYARQKRCPVIEAETALLGVGHDEIGKWLVTRWKLPAALAEPIALHHTPEKATRHAEATAVVHVADAMVRAYGFGFPGDPVMPDPSPHAWRLLRLNRSKIEEAVERMHRRLQGALAKANLYDELAG